MASRVNLRRVRALRSRIRRPSTPRPDSAPHPNDFRIDSMHRFLRALTGAAVFASGFAAHGQPLLPAAEPLYPVAVESAVVYGQGQVSNPVPGAKNLLLDLYRPVGAESTGQRSPAVVIIHGGGFTGGSRTQGDLVTIARAMAARGFVAVSIDYRLVPDGPVPSARVASLRGPATVGTSGADLAQRTAAVAAIDDALGAVDWLRANATRLNVDASRIGLLGGSAGAVTAVHLGYVLDDYGVAAMPFSFVVDLWGASIIPANDPAAAANHLEAGEPPLFVVHGTNDPTVPFAASELLVARAQGQRLAHEFHPITGGGHGFGAVGFFSAPISPGVTLFDRMLEWTVRTVRGQRTVTINYGMAGSWFNPATSGQGYLFEVEPVTQTLVVGWFAYDTTAGAGGALPGAEQRWFTAQGRYVGNRADLTVFQSRFGQLNRPNPVTTAPVGSMTVEFIDCGRATLTFNLGAFGVSGSVPIVRVLPDVLCQPMADGELRLPAAR
ncbi:MAG: alpha/beta hydrolase [Xanthomonadaceae bacterium]|nr:alpha/beta hydrolase [Xanthomonadaceae bacterium]